MDKRILAALLLFGGLVAIGAVIWWVVAQGGSGRPTTEPTQLPTQQPLLDPSTGRQINPDQVTQPTKIDPQSPEERERQAQEALKRHALSFAARYGSYSNTDEFGSWRSLGVDITAGVQPYLVAEQKKLLQAHPQKDGYWGQTTKALSSRITSALPVLGKTTAEVTVQTQQTITADAQPNPSVSYQEMILSYSNVNGTWLVSRITLKPLVL
jgi:hypothetical protein